MNGEPVGFDAIFGVIGGLIEGLAVGGCGLAISGFGIALLTGWFEGTFFCVVVGLAVLLSTFLGDGDIILLIKDFFLGAGDGEDDAAGFALGF